MTKKALKLEEMNAAEYRKHLQQQSFELRMQAVKATGDAQATILHASDAAKAKATEIFEAPLVAKADERRVSAPVVGNVEAAPSAVPAADSGKSTAETNPPQVKQTTVSDDSAKK